MFFRTLSAFNPLFGLNYRHSDPDLIPSFNGTRSFEKYHRD